jgi:hypothetical protein
MPVAKACKNFAAFNTTSSFRISSIGCKKKLTDSARGDTTTWSLPLHTNGA